MKTFYTAYTKEVLGTTYYFVKQFISFPEFNNVPDVLENYGMHKEFDEACKIAKVADAEIRQQLLKNIQDLTENARVIPMSVIKNISKQA